MSSLQLPQYTLLLNVPRLTRYQGLQSQCPNLTRNTGVNFWINLSMVLKANRFLNRSGQRSINAQLAQERLEIVSDLVPKRGERPT